MTIEQLCLDIIEKCREVERLIARTAPKPATTPMGSTYEPGRASSFFDDERWDGIENGN
jgi:hypothetical protein